MSTLARLKLAYRSLVQLGAQQVGLYALYQLGLRSGYYQRQLATALERLEKLSHKKSFEVHPCLNRLPDRDQLLDLYAGQVQPLYDEAGEITRGDVRLFGSRPVPLTLSFPKPLEDWTRYEQGDDQLQSQDIKLIWEPARFGWAIKLAMAYHLSKNEHYAEAFWTYTELFIRSNPPYLGPHWSSAQEVAIRLVALAYAMQVFSPSPRTTSQRMELISKAIATHAERIPPTLVYARSQNNNHLLTEALGLYTASALLPDHPRSSRWHALGWRWLKHAFRTQIDPDGTYIQHSTNYHRLMLQVALWARAVQLSSFPRQAFPDDISSLLASSTAWLWKMVDPDTGHVPNLGHNDGAYILPLSICLYHDYRPVIIAAACAFLHTRLAPPGPWHDMVSWFCLPQDRTTKEVALNHWHSNPPGSESVDQAPHLLINPVNGSWGALQVKQFHSRPAHADQLHLDLWWRGLNLAIDPGTYLYNSDPPWDNSLTAASVHNTVTVDGQEPMQHVSRFLYLDWDQGRVLPAQINPLQGTPGLSAEHDGYSKLGVMHKRKVSIHVDGHWEVNDYLEGPSGSTHSIRLHWLFPDWQYWVIEPVVLSNHLSYAVRILTPHGWMVLKLGLSISQAEHDLHKVANLLLARAGEVVMGKGTVSPICGWTSPTYGDKIPALACIFEITHALPVELTSEWFLPDEAKSSGHPHP